MGAWGAAPAGSPARPRRRVALQDLPAADIQGAPYTGDLAAMAPQVSAPMTAPRMPGAFGRAIGAVNRFMTPDRWERLAAGLGDLSDGGDRLSQVMASQRGQAFQQAQLDRRNAIEDEELGYKRDDRAAQEAQRRALQEVLAGLPEGERVLAMLDPEGFVRSMMKTEENPYMVVAPGGSLIDRRTGKRVYQAPFAPRSGAGGDGALEPWDDGYFGGGD
ncbi:MAG: hypothetical protein EBR82_37950 [Caulobacteraceae bacterium]|nr:hypothetical protein [Caulobacteraceae bacterium]